MNPRVVPVKEYKGKEKRKERISGRTFTPKFLFPSPFSFAWFIHCMLVVKVVNLGEAGVVKVRCQLS